TATPGPLGGGPPPTATMSLLGGDGDRPGAASASATMVLLPPGDPATRPQPTAASPEPPAASPEPEPTPISPEVTAPPRPAMDPAAARTTVDTWEVGAGDCFWSIAESIVAETTGHAPPSEQATSDYWSRLVAANRDRLAAPDHPDLLIPGQILVIPQPS
ncbi:MAG: LysM peptidoglycan-binding domain-containing protein, partial [Acidimicrobiales bacterium]